MGEISERISFKHEYLNKTFVLNFPLVKICFLILCFLVIYPSVEFYWFKNNNGKFIPFNHVSVIDPLGNGINHKIGKYVLCCSVVYQFW